MKIEEFRVIAKDLLTDSWGANAFPPAQLNRLWDLVRDIGSGDFRHALEQVNLTCNRAPSLAQIRTGCAPAMARAREDKKRSRLKELAEIATCRYCGNGGWVEAHRIGKPQELFAFICSCDSAQLLGLQPTKNSRYWRDASADESWVLRSFDGHADKMYQQDILKKMDDLAKKFDITRAQRA